MRAMRRFIGAGLLALAWATPSLAADGDGRPLPPPRVVGGNGWTTPQRPGASVADAPRAGTGSGWTTPVAPTAPRATGPVPAPPPPPVWTGPLPTPPATTWTPPTPVPPRPPAVPVQPVAPRYVPAPVAPAPRATAAAAAPCPYGRFEIQLEGSYSFLQAPDGPFGVPAVGPGLVQMRWNVLDYPPAWGGRATLRYAVAPQHWIQARGAYVGMFDDTARAAGRFAFRPVPPGGGGVSAATTARLRAEADLYSGELGYVAQSTAAGSWRVDLSGSARFLRFNETARADDWGGTGIVLGPALAQGRSENTFVGLQLGTDVHADLSQRLTFTIGLRGLVGYLKRDLTVEDQNFFVGGVHRSTSSQDAFGWGGEAEVGFRFRLTPRIAATLGYSLLLLDGVVRGHDALDFTRADTGALQPRHETSVLVVHSVLAGLHLNF